MCARHRVAASMLLLGANLLLAGTAAAREVPVASWKTQVKEVAAADLGFSTDSIEIDRINAKEYPEEFKGLRSQIGSGIGAFVVTARAAGVATFAPTKMSGQYLVVSTGRDQRTGTLGFQVFPLAAAGDAQGRFKNAQSEIAHVDVTNGTSSTHHFYGTGELSGRQLTGGILTDGMQHPTQGNVLAVNTGKKFTGANAGHRLIFVQGSSQDVKGPPQLTPGRFEAIAKVRLMKRGPQIPGGPVLQPINKEIVVKFGTDKISMRHLSAR